MSALTATVRAGVGGLGAGTGENNGADQVGVLSLLSDDSTRWAQAIAGYLLWLRAGGVRPGTIDLRRWQLGHLREAQLRRSPWTVTTTDLVGWLSAQAWAPETRKSYRTTLQSFYRWGKAAGHARRDPAAALPPVRTMSPPPRPTPEQVLSMAAATATDRDRLILLLAAYSGLRRAEIAGLRWDDLSRGPSIRVRGKGGRIRLVPLHRRAAVELSRERRRRRGGGCGSGYRYGGAHLTTYVFPGPSSGGHVTAATVGKIASRVLGPGWTLHTLRHRFATKTYANTRDLLAVQALLGHSKPETTKRYTELADDALRAAVRSL